MTENQQNQSAQNFIDALMTRCEKKIRQIGIGNVTACLLMVAASYLAASDDDEFIKKAQLSFAEMIERARIEAAEAKQ